MSLRSFVFDKRASAIAWVGDAGFDELSIHVALWPTPDGERWVRVANAGQVDDR